MAGKKGISKRRQKKRPDAPAAEGLVGVAGDANTGRAAGSEDETDFVARKRNQEFRRRTTLTARARQAAIGKAAGLGRWAGPECSNLTEMVDKIGANSVRRAAALSGNPEGRRLCE